MVKGSTMKLRNTRKSFIICLLLTMMLSVFMTGCGGAEGSDDVVGSSSADSADKIECVITVEDHCDSVTVEIAEGGSVYDALQESGADVSARNTGYGLYIEGINSRFEFDEGPTSGWVYTVNGERTSSSCDKYEVKEGDEIVWTYTEEL